MLFVNQKKWQPKIYTEEKSMRRELRAHKNIKYFTFYYPFALWYVYSIFVSDVGFVRTISMSQCVSVCGAVFLHVCSVHCRNRFHFNRKKSFDEVVLSIWMCANVAQTNNNHSIHSHTNKWKCYNGEGRTHKKCIGSLTSISFPLLLLFAYLVQLVNLLKYFNFAYVRHLFIVTRKPDDVYLNVARDEMRCDLLS